MNKLDKELIELHIKAEYFIKVVNLPKIRGIKTQFPDKKIDLNDKKRGFWKLYESEKDLLTIYKSGHVIKKINLHEQFHRCLITADFFNTCLDFNISDQLCVTYEDKKIVDYNFDIFKMINVKKTKKEKQFTEILKILYENKNPENHIKEYHLEEEALYLEEIFEIGGY